MAEIMTIFVMRISRLLGLTASAAVTATSALGAAPTNKLAAVLAEPQQQHHSQAVPGMSLNAATVEPAAVLPKTNLALSDIAAAMPDSIKLPDQRPMPGWLASRARLDAKRNALRARNALKQLPVRQACAPKRYSKRVVWH